MKIKPSSSSNVATDAETRVNLTSEIARLQSLLQQASAENQAWSEKYGKLETEHASLRETFAGIQQRGVVWVTEPFAPVDMMVDQAMPHPLAGMAPSQQPVD